MSDVIFAVYFFILGACFGSFLNVCIARWPFELSVVRPRSRCPRCGQSIAWYDNIPIVSWLLLRGRCRGCALPISLQYPFIELLVALGWTVCALVWGPTALAVRIAVFGTILLGIAITDARHYLIPDGFTVFGLAWVFVTSVYGEFSGGSAYFVSPWNAILGACVGAGAIRIVGWLGEVFLRKEAMGFGDETLMAMVGAALGPGRALLTIFAGAVLGAAAFLLVVYPLVRRRAAANAQLEMPLPAPSPEMPQVPFGVFLAPAAFAALLWGEAMIDWYLRRIIT